MNAFTKSTSASTKENNFVHFANFIFSMVGGRGEASTSVDCTLEFFCRGFDFSSHGLFLSTIIIIIVYELFNKSTTMKG